MARRTAIRGFLLGLSLLTSGCMTTNPRLEPGKEPSTNSTVYSNGSAVGDLPREPGAVMAVVAEALGDLQMTELKRSRDGLSYLVEAQTKDGRAVRVAVRPHQNESRVACRVGLFGDQPLSSAVIERVGIRVGALPPAAIPESPPSQPSPNPFFARFSHSFDDFLRGRAEAPNGDEIIP